MVSYTGLCAYPHGGYISAGLLVTCAGALACTTYAVASCQFLVVTYTTDRGGWEGFFEIYKAANQAQQQTQYKTAVGLFQWLEPYSSQDWSNGTCLGYAQSMLQAFSSTKFETARVFGVFAVMFSFVITLWCLFMACLAMDRSIQVNLFRGLIFFGFLSSCLTFLIFDSPLCGGVLNSQSCKIDQGGLIMVAAVILWLASCFLSVVFLRVDKYDEEMAENASLEKAREAGSIASSKRSYRDDDRMNTPETRRSYSFDSIDSKHSSQASARLRKEAITVDDMTQPEQLEVYTTRRLDRIENMIAEI